MRVSRSAALAASSSLADVGFMSLASLLVTWTAAQTLSVNALGLFSICFSLSTVLQTVLQGGLGMIILRTHGAQGGLAFRWIERISALLIGIGLAGATTILLAPKVGIALVAASLGWLYARHSLARAVLVSCNEETTAIKASALVFIGAVIAALGAVLMHWSFQLIISLYLIFFVLSFRIGNRRVRGWYSRSSQPSPRLWKLSFEQLILAGGVQIAGVLVVIPLGLSFSAALRGVSVLLGPVSSLFTAVRPILTPRFARATATKLPRYALALSAALLIVSALWSFLVWLLLVWNPTLLLGASGAVTQQWFWPFAVGTILQSGYFGLFLAARSAALDRWLLVSNGVFLTIVALSTALVFLTSEAKFYFMGTYLSQIISSIIVIVALLSGRRRTSLTLAPE